VLPPHPVRQLPCLSLLLHGLAHQHCDLWPATCWHILRNLRGLGFLMDKHAFESTHLGENWIYRQDLRQLFGVHVCLHVCLLFIRITRGIFRLLQKALHDKKGLPLFKIKRPSLNVFGGFLLRAIHWLADRRPHQLRKRLSLWRAFKLGSERQFDI